MNLLDILDQLQQNAAASPSEYLEVFEFAEDRAPDGKWEEIKAKYSEAVSRVSERWGPPHFEGSWEDPGFPEWHDWVALLAYWCRGDAVVFLEFDQQDNELPITLRAGALIPS
jgi:hypothetical protein